MHLQCVFTNLLLKLWESEDQCFHIFRDRSNFENTNNLSLQDFSDFYASLIFLTFYSWYISQTHQWNKYDQIYECYIRKKYFLLHATVACIIVRRLLISVHKWQSSEMAATHVYWSQHDAHLEYLPIFHGLNLVIFS